MSFARAFCCRPAALAASAALCAGALVSTAGQAQAAPSTSAATTTATSATAATAVPAAAKVVAMTSAVATSTTSAVTGALALSTAVVNTAASLIGRPYRWGGNGPYAFDCSGYTKYVYKTWGITIPRTAQQQYRASHKIAKSAIRPGDLVFFVSGGYAYHVAIYAGNGMIWHAPHSGSSVQKVKIWTSAWVAGRFI